MTDNLEALRFPIGKFQKPEFINQNQIQIWIENIENFPSKLENEIKDLSEKDLVKTYRPNGWTITQIVNHCADSHINAFTRFKLALTEDEHMIKPYLENKWADLSENKHWDVCLAWCASFGTYKIG